MTDKQELTNKIANTKASILKPLIDKGFTEKEATMIVNNIVDAIGSVFSYLPDNKSGTAIAYKINQRNL